MRKFSITGDGLLTALHLISEVIRRKSTLNDLASFMSRYPQVLINVKDVDKNLLSTNDNIRIKISEIEKSLGNSGRVLLRASGTEPVIRVMVEAAEQKSADEFAQSLAALVKSELSI
jgi:phosphoglucosamine mutase